MASVVAAVPAAADGNLLLFFPPPPFSVSLRPSTRRAALFRNSPHLFRFLRSAQRRIRIPRQLLKLEHHAVTCQLCLTGPLCSKVSANIWNSCITQRAICVYVYAPFTSSAQNTRHHQAQIWKFCFQSSIKELESACMHNFMYIYIPVWGIITIYRYVVIQTLSALSKRMKRRKI